jgi:hypothetical protein
MPSIDEAISVTCIQQENQSCTSRLIGSPRLTAGPLGQFFAFHRPSLIVLLINTIILSNQQLQSISKCITYYGAPRSPLLSKKPSYRVDEQADQD